MPLQNVTVQKRAAASLFSSMASPFSLHSISYMFIRQCIMGTDNALSCLVTSAMRTSNPSIHLLNQNPSVGFNVVMYRFLSPVNTKPNPLFGDVFHTSLCVKRTPQAIAYLMVLPLLYLVPWFATKVPPPVAYPNRLPAHMVPEQGKSCNPTPYCT
jgi:hypothetical protein